MFGRLGLALWSDTIFIKHVVQFLGPESLGSNLALKYKEDRFRLVIFIQTFQQFLQNIHNHTIYNTVLYKCSLFCVSSTSINLSIASLASSLN